MAQIAAIVSSANALVNSSTVPAKIGMSVEATAVCVPVPKRTKAVFGPAFTIRMTSCPPDGPALAGVGVDDTSVASKVADPDVAVTDMDLVLEKFGLNGWTFILNPLAYALGRRVDEFLESDFV